MIATAIQEASNLKYLSNCLKNIKSEFSTRSVNYFIHLKNALPLLSSVQNPQNSQTLRDLDAFLLLNNMERINIAGDGNCFFVSLATMIQEQLSKEH